MERDRRRFLIGAGTGLTAALAGCNTQSEGGATETDAATDAETTATAAETDEGSTAAASVGTATAVAAEWTAMRARLFDAVALAEAGRPGAGAAVVGAGGGWLGELPATAAQATFQAFENARVHETPEEADNGTYESFEAALGEFVGAVRDGGDAAGAVATFADHATRAQFAVVGGLGKAPSVAGGGSSDSGSEAAGETEYEGGPNVVSADEVPDDATVVDIQAVAFAPEEVTVSKGDTVAFVHASGEAHNVVAYADKIPEGAPEWNSAGADSEAAATEAWEAGRGAVVSGQAYVRTFETVGEHGYYCVPHEMAGMVGTVIVEE